MRGETNIRNISPNGAANSTHGGMEKNLSPQPSLIVNRKERDPLTNGLFIVSDLYSLSAFEGLR